MTTLNVKSAIERSLGKVGGIGDERFEIRFWLSVEVNGRNVESRGETLIITAVDIADARLFAQGGEKHISEKVTGMAPKDASAAMPALIDELRTIDADWQAISHVFDN